MTPDNAMKQASDTAETYMRNTFYALTSRLDIDPNKPGFREALAPFACVWAAMIETSAKDFHTATVGGVVDGSGDPGLHAVAEALLKIARDGLDLRTE
ncbi:hypothetical protein [Magnetospirillum aberrantis]|uniref:Uncharacterized protein n=1 Tax=Magnetospirillum aberrantis SpK TaxID=908842 RepID=A0A7C9QVW4_9PROT|nr:hypothetical protein [Magnetospirillum aberrantis]NFV81884.1 hypothetical protein [Magnetospirillum aberrantis SpK]